MEQRRVQCTIRVEGLDCPSEEPPIQRALDGAPGVSDFEIEAADGTVSVRFDPARTDPERLARRITASAGMTARPIPEPSDPSAQGAARTTRSRGRLTLLAGAALGLGFGLHLALKTNWPGQLAFGLAVLLGGAPLPPKAWAALRSGRLGIHALMLIAIAGAVGLGEWGEAATVAVLFGISELLEARSLARAKRAVRGLLELEPEAAERVAADGATQLVSVSELRPGDRVRVRAGAKVPIDGRVVAGRTSIDEKAITGESVPSTKGPGDQVFAGTANGEGAIEVEATKAIGDSVVSRTAELVRQAQNRRMPMERAIERFAAIYTPIAVALSAALILGVPLASLGLGFEPAWRTWFFRGLVVLVASCPCALVIGVPVAVVSGLAAAARRGVLVKGGQFLEAFGRLKILAFDKTGTLTQGEPKVVEVVPTADGNPDRLLTIAAALGDQGGHLIGRAIARHARDRALNVPTADDYRAEPGRGAFGTVDSTRYYIGSHRYIDESGLCDDAFHERIGAVESGIGTAVALSGAGGPIGWIRLADRPRPEAEAVIGRLRALGLSTLMLTGDNESAAAETARRLGLTDHRAGLLPEDKARIVRELEAKAGPSGMVGDGVNDAPALASATVSVAMGGIGSASALETANVVLMAESLEGLPWLVGHSRRTLRIIRQNIALAIGAKAVVIALAIVGWADLWMAIAADVGTTLIVVANALRLLRSTE